jgi:hypothetical protein
MRTPQPARPPMRPVPTAQRTERARKQERPLGTLRLRAPHAKRCAFSHPDCTVGSGVSPDHAPAEPLPLAGSTADRELAALPPHPAPKACKNLQLAAIVPPWPAAGSPSAGGRAGPHSAFGISPPPRGRARFGRCADTRTGEPASGGRRRPAPRHRVRATARPAPIRATLSNAGSPPGLGARWRSQSGGLPATGAGVQPSPHPGASVHVSPATGARWCAGPAPAATAAPGASSGPRLPAAPALRRRLPPGARAGSAGRCATPPPGRRRRSTRWRRGRGSRSGAAPA